MKKYVFLITMILPILLASQSLPEIVQAALENNKQLKAAKLETTAAENDQLSEERSHLPALSLKASYAHVTESPQIEFPPAIAALAGGPISLNPKNSYETGIQLDYVIFSGFAQNQAAKVKEFEHKISQLDENQKTKDIIFNTIEAYRQAQLMKTSLDILGKALERNTLQMTRIKALLENGMALRIDTLSLALNRMDIEQQIIQSQSVLESWYQLLQTLSGIAINDVQLNSLNSDFIINDFSSDEQSAIQTIRFHQKKLQSFKKILQADFYPKIKLSASYNYGKPGIDIIANEWSTYGRLMVGMQWNIWSWWSDWAAIQSSDLKYNAMKLAEESLADQLALKYDKAIRSFETLKKQNLVSKKAVEVAREKMQIIEVNTENGQLSTSDFNEANLELSQAELKQQQILIQLNLQTSKIDYLSGKSIKTWRY